MLASSPACCQLPGAEPRPPPGRFGHRELPGQAKADKATEAGKPRRIQVGASHPVRRTKIRYSIRMLEPAILPAQRPSRQQFSQVNRLCLVWNPADNLPRSEGRLPVSPASKNLWWLK